MSELENTPARHAGPAGFDSQIPDNARMMKPLVDMPGSEPGAPLRAWGFESLSEHNATVVEPSVDTPARGAGDP